MSTPFRSLVLILALAVSFPSAADTVIEDQFEALSGTEVPGRTPDPVDAGGAWSSRDCRMGECVIVANSALQIRSTFTALFIDSTKSAAETPVVEADMLYFDNVHLMLGFTEDSRSGSTANGYSCLFEEGRNDVEILRWDEGSVTSLASDNDFHIRDGDTLAAKLSPDGTIVCAVNNVQVLSATDTTHSEGTYTGLYSPNGTENETVESFSVKSLPSLRLGITVQNLDLDQRIWPGETLSMGTNFQATIEGSGVDCVGDWLISAVGDSNVGAPPSVPVARGPMQLGPAAGTNSMTLPVLFAGVTADGTNNWKVSAYCNGAEKGQIAFESFEFFVDQY